MLVEALMRDQAQLLIASRVSQTRALWPKIKEVSMLRRRRRPLLEHTITLLLLGALAGPSEVLPSVL
jgi:hypothetical protein